ncbi:MAG: cbb3-type cytochrome oxidase assembly protein CcoS [Deltaproteobacteria bacterium]|nr:cbb3-type cytochrome oxidase assembly protein CcoS [Deltaproteobacteria bacterium]
MGLEILYILIPVSMSLAILGLIFFLWANHSGQFDDLSTPAIKILDDEDLERISSTGEER